MTASKKLVQNADGSAATTAAATVGDVFTTIFSMDSAVTGMHGLAQKAILLGAGMAFQNYRLGRGWNPISAE
jgi:hypothetical protein